MSDKLAGYKVTILEDMADNLIAVLPPPRLVAVSKDKEAGKTRYTWEFKPGVLFVNGLLQQNDKDRAR